MNNLVLPNKNEALSVDARQELDLRIGCAFTRFQTKYFQGKYGDLDSTLVSYGPCQTPTLTFCVDRLDKIKSFKPENFWYLDIDLKTNGKKIAIKWSRVHLFDKEVVYLFYNDLKSEKNARVIDVRLQEKSKARPLALNTVEMLRSASAGMGMSPMHTMSIAERLYTQGFISYPRTETTQYPTNFDFKQVLVQQQNNSIWGDHVKQLLNGDLCSPRKGTDVGDHPPITPTAVASQNELSGDAWKLYEFVTRTFIATVILFIVDFILLIFKNVFLLL
jgi:DNA topoisomerase-3